MFPLFKFVHPDFSRTSFLNDPLVKSCYGLITINIQIKVIRQFPTPSISLANILLSYKSKEEEKNMLNRYVQQTVPIDIMRLKLVRLLIKKRVCAKAKLCLVIPLTCVQ